MAGRSYDRQESSRREYLCHVHALWSLVTRLHQWLVQSRYLGRPAWPALQVGLRDVEIGESGPHAGRCTKYLSREGCIMLWPPTGLETRGRSPVPLAPRGPRCHPLCDSVSAQGRTGPRRDRIPMIRVGVAVNRGCCIGAGWWWWWCSWVDKRAETVLS